MARIDNSGKLRERLYSHADVYPDGTVQYWCNLIEHLPNHFKKFSGEKRATPLHRHVNTEMLYIMKSRVNITVDNETFEAKQGDLIIFNSDSWHSMNPTGTPFSYYCIILDTEFANFLGLRMSELNFRPKVHSETVSFLINRLIDETDKKQLFYEQNIQSYLTSLIIHLVRNYTVKAPGITRSTPISQGEIVKSVQKYLEKNFTRKISLDDIASGVGFNKFHIARVFKKITGTTIHEALNIIRCKEANKLLSQTNEQISDVSLKVGFENLSHFSYLYKEYTGITPSEYRKKMHKN